VAPISKIKGDEITISADNLLALVGGSSTMVLTPGGVALAGSKIKLDSDGDVTESAPLIVQN